LIAYYRKRDLLSDLDGSGKIDEVQDRLLGLLAERGLA
jgi:hypothetical protein